MRLLVIGFVLSLAPSRSAAAADGAEALYRSKCAACHGARGEGARLAPQPIAGASEASVLKLLKGPKGKMRLPRDVTDEQIGAVARYVAALKR